MSPLFGMSHVNLASSLALQREPSTTIDSSDGIFTLTFPPVDLRPYQTEILERYWAVLVPAGRTDPVVADWTATATNANGQAHGTITIMCAGPDVNLYETFARIAADE